MKILNLSNEVVQRTDHLYSQTATHEAKKIWHNKRTVEAANIINELNCPIEPGSFVGLNYDSKTDRYVISFIADAKKFSYKVSEDVAQFVAENSKLPGYWRLRMEKGTVVDVTLVTY